MREGDNKTPPREGIHPRVIDAVSRIEPHNGGEKRPSSKGADGEGRDLGGGVGVAVEAQGEFEGGAEIGLKGIEDGDEGDLQVWMELNGRLEQKGKT